MGNQLGSEVAGFVAADNTPDKISEDQRSADNLPILHLYRYIINKWVLFYTDVVSEWTWLASFKHLNNASQKYIITKSVCTTVNSPIKYSLFSQSSINTIENASFPLNAQEKYLTYVP